MLWFVIRLLYMFRLFIGGVLVLFSSVLLQTVTVILLSRTYGIAAEG